jgi:DNA-binding MarR family transcriptional regulator
MRVTGSKLDLQTAASALSSGAIRLLRSLGAVDRQAGLTPARLSALSVLVFGGPCTLGALAAAEGVAGPTMTRIVDGLIAEGLAERRPHPIDGRAVSVAATADGEALLRAAQRRRIDALAAAMASLPAAAQREIASSASLLDQLASAVLARSAGRPVAGPSARSGSERGGRGSNRQVRLEAARARWAEAADLLTAASRRAEAEPPMSYGSGWASR